jgi:hypothetical protein
MQDRRGGRAAKKNDEFPPSHAITQSALLRIEHSGS